MSDFIKVLLTSLAMQVLDDPAARRHDRWFARYTAKALPEKSGCGHGTPPDDLPAVPADIEQRLKDQLKFEEVLRLASAAGVDLGALIRAAYLVDSYNLNHAALGYLASTGRYRVLTTNFDTAIEASTPLTVLTLSPGEQDVRGTLVKMHGCAREGDLVATSGALMTGIDSRRYAYVQDLCRGSEFLTFGYSCTGDVDIAPYLEAVAQTRPFKWFSKPGDRPPFDGAVLHPTNLKADTDEGNALLQLASAEGWVRPAIPRAQAWSPRPMMDVLAKLSTRQAGMLLANLWSLVDARFYRVHHVLAFSGATDEGRRAYVAWYASNQIDPPPARWADNVELLECLRYSQDESFKRRWSAFARWRLGQTRHALRIARGVLADATESDATRMLAANLVLGIACENAWIYPWRHAWRGVGAELVGQAATIAEDLPTDYVSVELRIATERNLLHWRILTADRGPARAPELKALETHARLARDLGLKGQHQLSWVLYRALSPACTDTASYPASHSVSDPATPGDKSRLSLGAKKKRLAMRFKRTPYGWILYGLLERWSLRAHQLWPTLQRWWTCLELAGFERKGRGRG